MTQRDEIVQGEVLRILRERSLRTSELMRQVSGRGISASDAREVVWALLDEGRLEISSDRRLTIS